MRSTRPTGSTPLARRMTHVAERNEVGRIVRLEVPLPTEVAERDDVMNVQAAFVGRRTTVGTDKVAPADGKLGRTPRRTVVRIVAPEPSGAIWAGVDASLGLPGGKATSRTETPTLHMTRLRHESLSATLAILRGGWRKRRGTTKLAAKLGIVLAPTVDRLPCAVARQRTETSAGLRWRRRKCLATLFARCREARWFPTRDVRDVRGTRALARTVLSGPARVVPELGFALRADSRNLRHSRFSFYTALRRAYA